jgi:hypothetical protein
LLPVKALSKIFRAKFRDALRKRAPDTFAEIPAEVWKKEWVVHSQPVGNGLSTLKYLAPYIFRVAISNQRILKLANGKVTFRYRTTDTGGGHSYNEFDPIEDTESPVGGRWCPLECVNDYETTRAQV